jgi:hypothetical protein
MARRGRPTGRRRTLRTKTDRWWQAGEVTALVLKILIYAVALAGMLASGNGCGLT